MPVTPTNFDEEPVHEFMEQKLGHRIDTEVPMVVIGNRYVEAENIQVSKYKEIPGNTVSALITILPNKLSSEVYVIDEIEIISDKGEFLEYADDHPEDKENNIDRIAAQISFIMPNESVLVKCTVKRKEE